MGWPQVCVIILLTIAVWVGIDQHGKVKLKPQSMWDTLLGVALWLVLLGFGGFWDG